MQKIDVKKFKDKNTIEIIKEIMKVNNGYVTSQIITELGLHRMYIKIMQDRGILKKVASGTYIDKTLKEDPYYVFLLDSPNIVFSHFSALYLQGIGKKPKENEFDISVKNDYHNPKLKKYNLYYIKSKYYNLGLTSIETEYGNIVKTYDVERSICDIIKYRDRYDLEEIKAVIKKYLKSDKLDLKKLYKYAKELDVEEDVKLFITLIK